MNTGISWAAGGLIVANLGPTGSESGLGLSRICQWPVRVGSGSESDPPTESTQSSRRCPSMYVESTCRSGWRIPVLSESKHDTLD